ncbi:TRAP transporter substrate-binding protein [Castellaniella sp. S9]|uniref:TRAP transporter substrate-binding protein n=1 Tax=Castellaniella sp. S9 TaxID=2993652 RepID=UPI0022B508C7|nr:TRAP transporter substrate-binding protein [Castellaniella sp. S9]
MSKKTPSTSIKLALAAAMAGLALGAQAATLELQLGHTQPVNSPYDLTSHKFAEIVAQKSNGDIKVNVFPQSQLGGEVKMIQAARLGSLDMVITAQAVLGPTIKEYMIFDTPYLFDDIEQANKVLAGPVGRKYLDMLPKYGLVGLDFLYAIERDIASTKPIKNAKDFEGLKLRVMQAPGYVKTYEMLGSQPTPMAYNEVYLAMQQGVVDGGDFSPESVTLDKFTEVADYFNLTKTQYLPALLVYSKKKWDALPPETQKLLQDASAETMTHAAGFYKQTYDQAMAELKQSGMTIIDSDRADIKKAVVDVKTELFKSIPDGQKLYDEIQAAK